MYVYMYVAHEPIHMYMLSCACNVCDFLKLTVFQS